MFFVGSYSTFSGASKVENTKVKLVEKFGPHPKRANRWLDEHPPKEIDGEKYRSIVFVLPRNFRLSNDMVQAAAKRFKCDWQTAKFHVYREHLVDVRGNKADWEEFFPKQEKPVDQEKQYEEHASKASGDEIFSPQPTEAVAPAA